MTTPKLLSEEDLKEQLDQDKLKEREGGFELTLQGEENE